MSKSERKNSMVRIDLTSGLFHVTQPDTYWEFDGHLDWLEEGWREWYRDNEGREVEVDLNMHEVRRVLSRYWLKTFEEHLRDRMREAGTDIPLPNAVTEYTSTYAPKEYNFGGDECNFGFTIPRALWERIFSFCFVERRDEFAKYLHDYHSSRDGYMSYVESYLAWHEERYKRFMAGGELVLVDNVWHKDEHTYWVALDFFLFMCRGDASVDEDDHAEDASVNYRRFNRAFEFAVYEEAEAELLEAAEIRDVEATRVAT